MSDPTTLRDAIESAIDSAPAEEAAPTPAPEPSPEAVAAAPAPEAKAADAAPSRTRDEQGRFSKLAEEEAAKPPQEAPQAIQPGYAALDSQSRLTRRRSISLGSPGCRHRAI
jgi:hypothetical protein